MSIPGCSKGSAFVVTESPEGERTSVEIKTGRRFRLTGKKELLDEIKAREGYMIAVTGIIRKNDLAGRRHHARRRARPHRRRCAGVERRQPDTERRSRRTRSWMWKDFVRWASPARGEMRRAA